MPEPEYQDVQLNLDKDLLEKLINLSIDDKINLILTTSIQEKELNRVTMLSWHNND